MRHEVLVGVERRRRWSDDQKRSILSEVGADGATVAEVARRHEITRQHIYQWRREMRRKGYGAEAAPVFLPVSLAVPDEPSAAPPHGDGAVRVEIRLRNGRSLSVGADCPAAALRRVIRIAEEA